MINVYAADLKPKEQGNLLNRSTGLKEFGLECNRVCFNYLGGEQNRGKLGSESNKIVALNT
jgi:hypothetical protein